MDPQWELPAFETLEFSPKKTKYCFVVVCLNEGDRLRNQLARMQARADAADIIVADGRSRDGSTDPEFLRRNQVRTLLVTDEPGLSTATRMGLAYAIDQGYAGVVTVDGNGKDGIEALPEFISALDDGFDFVQGSRFRKGGYCKNTPIDRYLGVRLIMSPILSLGSGFFYTDPTNAFRACSTKFLMDPQLQPFRNLFIRFNLQLYLVYQAARLGYRVKEIPVRRVYPDRGPTPTKITSVRLKIINVLEMLLVALGAYNPPTR
jgi:hypothetical protein